ncbi:MAG: ATP-binding protein [Myxococcaceae bacterium]
MSKLIGRQAELQVLEKLYKSDQAEFLAIYGRRRVGKTFLIREFFKNKGTFFTLTGVKNSSTKKQLKNFSEELEQAFGEPSLDKTPKDWQEAFVLLRKSIDKVKSSKRIIVFLDELPWLATPRSGFLSDLDHLWNRYLSTDNRIILIVCGSAASWMIQKVISNKGGLHGRLTAQIRLSPFNLAETELFLKSRKITLERKQIVELYMALGGVAKYLSYIEGGKSVAQIVQEVCFSAEGPLYHEFHQLYESLFDQAEQHIQVVKALSTKWSGLTINELLKVTGIRSGGSFSALLRELEESGFILYIPDFHKKNRDGKYRLIDEFSLFYLRFMEEAALLKSLQSDYWVRTQMAPGYTTWAGYAFEGVCLKHLREILQALGLGVVAAHSSGWFSKEAQIDLLIDRSDACINLCEIKFFRDVWEMSDADAVLLNRRRERFRESTKTKKSLFMTLITPYGAKKNAHYMSCVDQQLTLEHLFMSWI